MSEEYETMAQSNMKLSLENAELLEKIDKAIEYIKSKDDNCYTDATCKYKVAEINITELLEILGDKENE